MRDKPGVTGCAGSEQPPDTAWTPVCGVWNKPVTYPEAGRKKSNSRDLKVKLSGAGDVTERHYVVCEQESWKCPVLPDEAGPLMRFQRSGNRSVPFFRFSALISRADITEPV